MRRCDVKDESSLPQHVDRPEVDGAVAQALPWANQRSEPDPADWWRRQAMNCPHCGSAPGGWHDAFCPGPDS
jgi:hypothetical protein